MIKENSEENNILLDDKNEIEKTFDKEKAESMYILDNKGYLNNENSDKNAFKTHEN